MKSSSKKTACIFLCIVFIAVGYVAYHYFAPIGTGYFPFIQSPKRTRLVFAGDLMQHMPQVYAARTPDGNYDYSQSFQYLKEINEQADLTILNFETTLTPKNQYTGYPMFRSPKQLAGAVKDMGVDIVVMANNHVCDNGRSGIEFTTYCFDSLGIAYTGAFTDSLQYQRLNPLIFNTNGLQFALLNYTYDTNGMPIPKGTIVNLIDTTIIARDIQQIDRSDIDCVIVFFHWGEEYARQPNKEQRMLADFCHKRGVELVIGSHPHVIQPVETHVDADSIIRSVTVYSLGNLVSNQRERYRNGGLIVTLDIEKLKDKPIQIDPYYTPAWVQLPKYIILPPAIGDTLSMPEHHRASYKQFMEDTRKLLRYNTIFKEI